jgi:hypothetical protein
MPGYREQSNKKIAYTFFHPDYTVGFGITPNHAISSAWTITTGGDLHPALKILNY